MRKSEYIYKVLTNPLFVFPLLLLMLMVNNGSVPLVDPGEAANALVALGVPLGDETLAAATTPSPLHVWLTRQGVSILGEGEFGIRFMSSLSAWGVLLLIYLYGRSMYHERAAMVGVIICGTCLIFPVLGKLAFMDNALMFFQTWAAFSLIALVQWRGGIHIVTFWTALGLGMLVNMPRMLLSVGIFYVLTFGAHPYRGRLVRTHPWFFLPLAMLPFAYHAAGGFPSDWRGVWLVFKEQWGLFAHLPGKGIPLDGMPGFYFFLFAFAFVPYFRYFLPAMWEVVRGISLWEKDPERLMLSLWVVSFWWIYGIFPEKAPAFALGTIVPIAILMAYEDVTLSDSKVFGKGMAVLSVLEIGLTILLAVMAYLFGAEYIGQKDLSLAVATFSLLPLASIVSLIWQWRRRFRLSTYTHLVLVGAFWVVGSIFIYPKMGKYWNGPELVAGHIAKAAGSGTVYIDPAFRRLSSLPYYLRRSGMDSIYYLEGWNEAHARFIEPVPFVAIMHPNSVDSINQQVTVRPTVINSHGLESLSEKRDYYIIEN